MKIPAVQSGLFKDVRARMDAAALLVVTPPEGKTPIVITSLNAVDSATGRRSASAGSAPLNTEGADEAALRVVTVGGRKWATMNVGATSRSGRESFGHFFSWGNFVGYNFSGVDWKVAPGYPGEGAVLQGGFSAENYALSPGSNLAALPLAADAAYANWGGAWRMPTAAEFEALIGSTGTTEDDIRLASTGSSRNPDSACILSFRYGFDAHGYSRALSGCNEDFRYLGHCVRAVAE